MKHFLWAPKSFTFLEHIFIIFSSVCVHAFPNIYDYYYPPQDKDIAIISGGKLGMFLRYCLHNAFCHNCFPFL